MKFLGLLFLPLLAASLLQAPVAAETISVSQTITITARVADYRAIIINDQGQMTKIISNTAVNITPKVYKNNDRGPALPLTPALLKQYKEIMAKQKQVVGVEIPVPTPVARQDNIRQLLFSSVSSLISRPSL